MPGDLVGDRINWNRRVDGFVCRLADEGVPVRAIQRALSLNADEVQEILREALASGRIITSPRNDWPAGSVAGRVPSFVPSPLDDSALIMACMKQFRITRLQAIVFLALIRRRECPRESLHRVIQQHRSATAKETDMKLIDVTICLLRKRVEGRFVIETVWSCGYSMAECYRKEAAKQLLEYLDLNESYLNKIVGE